MRRLRLPGGRHLRLPAQDKDDAGAIAVLVAVLLGGGVLLGMGALVIDVGTLAVEREQLQSGADAGAWAIAGACAKDATAPGCVAPDGLATGYAQANVNDGSADAHATVTRCPAGCASVGSADHCPAVPANLRGGIAQVNTSTRNDDGTTLLPPVLAQALDGGYDGSTVVACSQVVWGVAVRGAALGVGVGRCKWAESVGVDPEQPAGVDVQLTQGQSCAGAAPPPEFGWMGGEGPAGEEDCAATVAVDDVVPGTDGTGCDDALAAARDSGAPALVPILDQAGPAGFHVVGLGAFVVTDVTVAGASRVVTGHFTRMIVPARDALPGPADDYGTAVLTRIN